MKDDFKTTGLRAPGHSAVQRHKALDEKDLDALLDSGRSTKTPHLVVDLL